MSISEDDILLAKASCMAQGNTAAINMFVASWSTFDRKVKTSMQSKAEKYSGDGITLIYHTVYKYTGSTKSVIRDHLQQLNGLPAKFKNYQYNIMSICDYVVNCIRTLKSAGGKDAQAPKELVEALTISPSAEFNSIIHSHQSACQANNKDLDIDTIIDLACLTYQSILLRNE
eukprot:171149-Ditylum_brightwellii.AAC.1